MTVQIHGATDSKVVDRLTGHGTVLRDGQPLLEIDYEITIAPPAWIDRQAQAGGAMDVPEIRGRLLGPLYTAEDLIGRPHTLVLADGRELDFEVAQPDTNEIVGIGPLRSRSSVR